MSRVFRRDNSWWIDFKDAQGIRRRKMIGPSKRIAGEVLNGLLGKVARRQHLGIIDDSALSFADFAEIWRQRISINLKPGTRIRWDGIVRNHLALHLKGSLRSITLAVVESYIVKRLEAGADRQTVNRELGVLRHILKRAVSWEYLGRDPVEKWPISTEKGFGRTRYLVEDELPRLLAACADSRSPYLEAFVLVSLNTGMRRGEILSLTRKSIDWQRRIATLEDTKNGDQRHVPLNDTALEALRSLPVRIDGRLFPFEDGGCVTRAFGRAVKRAGIEDFRLHDLRHTFASFHAMAGTQGRGLQALLGHRDNRMTTRYSHLSETYLRTTVDGLNIGKDGTYVAPEPAAPIAAGAK